MSLRRPASAHAVLFRLRTRSSMERAARRRPHPACRAHLTFLSCFPREREYLFPPLTYLQPVRAVGKHTAKLAGAVFTVIEVEPKQYLP